MSIQKIAKYSVFLTFFPFIFTFLFPGKIAVVTILCSYPLIITLIYYKFKQPKESLYQDSRWVISLFTFSNLLILFRGVLDAKSAQDWTVFVSTSIPTLLFFPLSIFLSISGFRNIRTIFKSFMPYVALFATLLFIKPVLGMMDYAHAVSPIYLFILFLPYITNKWKIIILVIAFASLIRDITVRSNILNIFVALLISGSYYFKKLPITNHVLRITRNALLYLPIFFLILGLTGTFNIFKIGDYTGEYVLEQEGADSQDLAVDSRTGIYTDVFSALEEKEAYFFGLGGNSKIKTYLTKLTYANFKNIYAEGRRGTESGMLDYIQRGGFFGMLCYLLLFAKASYLAMFKTNNWLCVSLGLWVAFKCMFSFIEDKLIFSIHSLFILIPVGMCFNKEFRSLKEHEMRFFIRSIFTKNKGNIIKK